MNPTSMVDYHRNPDVPTIEEELRKALHKAECVSDDNSTCLSKVGEDIYIDACGRMFHYVSLYALCGCVDVLSTTAVCIRIELLPFYHRNECTAATW